MCIFENLQNVCDLLKRSARTLMEDYSALAEDTSQLVIQMFQAVPHAAILEIAKQVSVFTLRIYLNEMLYPRVNIE